jgi:hypothetical protein
VGEATIEETAQMSYCLHPPEKVTHDICQGDWKYRSIQWCRICGAIRVTLHQGEASTTPAKFVSPWTLSQDQEQERLGAW